MHNYPVFIFYTGAGLPIIFSMEEPLIM